HSIESNGVEPNESSIQVSLSSLETAHLTVRLNPNSNPGFAEFTVSAVSNNEPLVYDEATFRLMGGLDILVVDDDAGEGFESYYMNAITPFAETTQKVLGIWDMHADVLDNSYFNTTDIIVWFTGNTFQNGETIAPFDQLILGDYLNSGGRLLLSGQGIGFDIRTDQFMNQHLHMNYVMPYPQGDAIEGFTGDPISDGMVFELNGGESADNQSRQHRIISIDDYATPILRFAIADDSADCAMRIETPAYRTVYFAFGLEGINSNQTRADLMTASLDWLFAGVAAEDIPVTMPLEFSLGQNYPNPFNPETVIPFTLAERSLVTLNIYDILGREVVRLASGVHDAGFHSVNWNASNLSSGIYFYTLEAESGTNSFRNTRKLVLMK
ncbi:T9SS type A sorting domain-containing protein, partial [bacterium]|nr:T9SS type A sorting domain-containing protein [bacterium]